MSKETIQQARLINLQQVDSTGTANSDDYARDIRIAKSQAEMNTFNRAFTNPPDRLVTRFHRLNEVAEISEMDRVNGKFKEPLDEMRIEVAEWLNN